MVLSSGSAPVTEEYKGVSAVSVVAMGTGWDGTVRSQTSAPATASAGMQARTDCKNGLPYVGIIMDSGGGGGTGRPVTNKDGTELWVSTCVVWGEGTNNNT